MKRLLIVLALAGFLSVLWFCAEPSASNHSLSSHEQAALSSAAMTDGSQDQAAPLLGEALLRDYAKSSEPPENDLNLMAQLMDNFTLLVKSAAGRPLSANEDWAEALRGRNPARERFLPDQHAAFNLRGQLVDRWGTPLFFHAMGNGRFEIRSAGPDRKLWTADDLHRNTDGSFHTGAEFASRTEPRL
jgi:hypothetical protein